MYKETLYTWMGNWVRQSLSIVVRCNVKIKNFHWDISSCFNTFDMKRLTCRDCIELTLHVYGNNFDLYQNDLY